MFDQLTLQHEFWQNVQYCWYNCCNSNKQLKVWIWNISQTPLIFSQLYTFRYAKHTKEVTEYKIKLWDKLTCFTWSGDGDTLFFFFFQFPSHFIQNFVFVSWINKYYTKQCKNGYHFLSPAPPTWGQSPGLPSSGVRPPDLAQQMRWS